MLRFCQLLVLALLPVLGTVSPAAALTAKTALRAVGEFSQPRVTLEHTQRRELHQQNACGYGENASDSPLASRALPRSGPIARSLSAASRAEQLARKLKLNINSPTTRQVLNSLDDNVSNFVGQFRRGSINRELPSEVLDMTVEQALNHSSKVRKLLIDSRFVK